VIVPIDFEGVGAAATRNRAAAQATTTWLAFLDDDDELAHNHIEDLLDFAEETGADMVYPWFTTVGVDKSALLTVNDEGQLVSPEGVPFGAAQREMIAAGPEGDGRNFIPVTVLIRRSTFIDAGGFPLPNSDEWPHAANEDWGLFQKLAKSDAVIQHLNSRTWFWHFHSHSTLGGALR
jgi:glycosyltransferase involved in cell wall biosynthesis